MMNCSEVKELIQLYMDNELDACNTLTVQRHLDSCAGCAGQLDDFLRQDQLFQQAAQADACDTALLRQTILAAIRNEASNANRQPDKGRALRTRFQRMALLRVAAILILAMVAAFFLLRGSAPFINDKVYADAIQDHAHHCTLEVVDKLNRTVSDPEQLDRLCAENGKFDKTPELSAFGYGDIRARYCRVDKVRVLHLIYQNATAPPLSVFMCLHNARIIDEKLLTLKRQGYAVSSFTKAGVDVMVVASLDEKQTTEIARKIADSL